MLPLALLLSLQCYAADDAPLLLKAGDPAPVAGVLLPDALSVRTGGRLKGCLEENAHLVTAVQTVAKDTVSVPVVVLLVVGALALGAGLTVGGLAAGGKLK